MRPMKLRRRESNHTRCGGVKLEGLPVGTGLRDRVHRAAPRPAAREEQPRDEDLDPGPQRQSLGTGHLHARRPGCREVRGRHRVARLRGQARDDDARTRRAPGQAHVTDGGWIGRHRSRLPHQLDPVVGRLHRHPSQLGALHHWVESRPRGEGETEYRALLVRRTRHDQRDDRGDHTQRDGRGLRALRAPPPRGQGGRGRPAR